MSFVSKIFNPIRDEESGRTLDRKHRYSYMQRVFIAVMTAAVVLPLVITTTISFYQYRSLTDRETRDKLLLDTTSAKQSFETHINESLSTMTVVAQGYSYGELFDQASLETLFQRLRNEYWWVVDLGALDSSGTQGAYVGPYPFQGKNYSDQEWFQDAFPRKTYVSDIFTGFRGVPHFVVAVTNGTPAAGTYWMLRASIDSEHLASYISTINADAETDVFLVGGDGILRTQSSGHGNIGDFFDIDLAMASNNVTLVESEVNGSSSLVAYTRLEGLPWVLVLERQGIVYGESWNQFRLQLVIIVAACTMIAIFVVFRVTRFMVLMIKKADKRHDEVLAEAQHTAKLASVGQLAAGVAHEINNPLAIINEKIGLMRDMTKYSDDFPQRERFLILAGGAADAVIRCKDITHRLLGFARRMDVSRERLQVNDVIRDVVSFIEKEALYRDIEIRMQLDDALPQIESDRGQLQQIFLNIINNAIDAVDEKGSITITTELVKPGRVRTKIADTGPGIPQNVREHIFEPFFTTKVGSDSSGTGLGLSITYGLVKKLCGQIMVENAPDHGAEFIVDFPVECELEE